MENWGLVTYRESALLCSSCSSSVYDELFFKSFVVSSTISHELAHQWFGNFVSPKWWQHVWLSEGLATLFGNIATSLVRLDSCCIFVLISALVLFSNFV